MKRGRSGPGAFVALCAVLVAAGCASSGPAGGRAGREPTSPSARCENGTLGLETVSVSRRLRQELAIPDGIDGAAVVEVFPGSPAAAAGLAAGDLVEQIGPARITNACEFTAAAYGRLCDPVRIVYRRAGARLEADLTPLDQDALLDAACQGGTARACFRRAWTFWTRNQGIDRQYALELYQTACKSGAAEACAHSGRILMDRPDGAKAARAALERSCELGSGAGCAHLAFLHATGKGVGKDDRRAARFYVRSCDLGDAQGCYNVGLMADQGRGGARNLARAAARYEEACGMGSSPACTNLGYLHEKGTGVKKDAARALALYQRGCDGTACQPPNLNGCVNVGRAYRDGIGTAKDAARSASLFRQACDREPSPEDPGAAENRSRACSLLGALYLAGDGVEKDPDRGSQLSELGCERGDAFGCFNAAVTAADPAKAASFLEKACAAGDGEGCHDLGVAYEKGSGVARDRRRAADLFSKACGLGFKQACAKKPR